jgi:hypothetical protein
MTIQVVSSVSSWFVVSVVSAEFATRLNARGSRPGLANA